MTNGHQNHAVQTERWRYVQYHDGTSELYDHNSDPNEWTNLATRPESRDIVLRLQQALPGNLPEANAGKCYFRIQ